MTRRWFRFADWPLRFKMATLLVLASLIPLVLTTFVDIDEARSQSMRSADAVLNARADQLVGDLEFFHHRYEQSTLKLANLPDIEAFSETARNDKLASDTRVRATLSVWPKTDPNIRGVAILDADGVVRVGTEPALEGKNLSNLHYVRDALLQKNVISDIHVSDPEVDNIPSIAYAAPVNGTAQNPFVVVIWVRAQAIWDLAKASNELAGARSVAVLYNELGIRIGHAHNDDLVFHPAGSLDHETFDSLVRERRYGERTPLLLNEVRAFPEQFERARAASPDPTLFRGLGPVSHKGAYGVSRRLKTVPWTLFFMIPEESLLAPAATMTRAKVGLGAIIIVLALLAGTLFASAILRPIAVLTRATQALSSGDLSARIEANTGDEIGRLGASFNGMAASLVAARDDLEVRVQERTAALQIEIEDRKRAETRFRRFAESGIVGIVTSTLDGAITDVNDAFLSIVGYSREDFVEGKISGAILNTPERDVVDAAAMREVQQHGRSKPWEKELIRKDGTRVPVLTGVALLDPPEAIAFIIDLTERKRAEESIRRLREQREEDEKFRGLLESAPDAMVIVDRSGTIVLVNAQTERIFGHARAELLGKSIDVLVPVRFRGPHGAHRMGDDNERALQPLAGGTELFGLHKNRTEFPIEITLSPLETKDGVLVSSAIRDITNRKQAEEDLRRAKDMAETASRELEAFSYSVAHDLRAPLRGINGYSAALLEDVGDKLDGEAKEYLQRIGAGAERMGQLIDALLGLSRVSRADFARDKVNLSEIARAIVTQLRTTDSLRHVEVTIADDLVATGDPPLLRALLENLLGNAWKFTSKNNHALIEFGNLQLERESVLFIRDNGAGFDMTYAKKLFAPFQRLHATTDFAGTGIGLATVHRIVRRHGGLIWAESKVNEGTVFYFTLEKGAENHG